MQLPQITLAVDSLLECVPLAATLVRSFCVALGASSMEASQIELCVSEAMNNAIIHAYRGEDGHPVEVIAFRNGKTFLIEIRDHGIQMDPNILKQDRRPLLDLDLEHLDTASESGRGIAIMQSIMETLRYNSSHGTNRLVMTLSTSQTEVSHR